MLLELDHHSGVPIYRQIINQIAQMIASGELVVGEQLPSVRDLASRLKVNPMTISKAYSLMENDQLLERRRGVGIFVSNTASEKSQQAKLKEFQQSARQIAVLARQLGLDHQQAVAIINEQLSIIQREN